MLDFTSIQIKKKTVCEPGIIHTFKIDCREFIALQKVYRAEHPLGLFPVELNDVVCICFMTFVSLIQVGQCFIYEVSEFLYTSCKGLKHLEYHKNITRQENDQNSDCFFKLMEPMVCLDLTSNIFAKAANYMTTCHSMDSSSRVQRWKFFKRSCMVNQT